LPTDGTTFKGDLVINLLVKRTSFFINFFGLATGNLPGEVVLIGEVSFHKFLNTADKAHFLRQEL
jgi:hypothetical protein